MRHLLAGLFLIGLAAFARAEDRVVQLEVAGPATTDGSQGGLIVREVLRQSVLIAAREELSWHVRDAALGESFAPAGSGCITMKIVTECLPGKKSSAWIEVGDKKQVLSGKVVAMQGADPDYAVLVGAFEGASRATIIETLKNLGLDGAPGKTNAEAQPDEAVLARLAVLTPVEQLAAARELHAAIRAGGQSVAMLSALARAYANLGVLTENQWASRHATFKARALLYAARACALDKKSSDALWTRAYAFALSGVAAAAEKDVAAAKTAGTTPRWARNLDAFVRRDTKALRAVTAAEEVAFARLLAFLTVEHQFGSRLPLDVGLEALEKSPECYRIADALNEYGGVSSLHRTTLYGTKVLAKTLAPRLVGLPGVPAKVKKLAEEGAAPAALIAALREADDAGEPSWGVAGALVEETLFDQARRRLAFMKEKWSVPVDEELPAWLELVGPHRYRGYLESFGETVDLAGLKVVDAEVRELKLLKALGDGERSLRFALYYVDGTRHELETAIHMFRGSPYGKKCTDRLAVACPRSPVLVEGLIGSLPRAEAVEKAPGWEKEHADDPFILRLIALMYQKEGRTDDLVRCLERASAVAADAWCYETLASVYEQRGDRAKWKETLAKVLELPDPGLDHARVRVKLARYHMDRGEWKDALPFADDAAETWAQWAMQCAFECHEGAGDSKGAEVWLGRLAQRYPGYQTAWYFFCRRTGLGDLTSATKLIAAHFKAMRGRASGRDLEAMGAFALMEGEKEDARRWFQKGWEHGRFPECGLVLALESEGEKRTELLEAVRKSGGGDGALAGLAKLMLKVASKEQELDAKAVDEVLARGPADERAAAGYAAGRWLVEQSAGADARRVLGEAAAVRRLDSTTYAALARTLLDSLPEAKKER